MPDCTVSILDSSLETPILKEYRTHFIHTHSQLPVDGLLTHMNELYLRPLEHEKIIHKRLFQQQKTNKARLLPKTITSFIRQSSLYSIREK